MTQLSNVARKPVATIAIKITEKNAISKVSSTCYQYREGDMMIEFVTRGVHPAFGGYVVKEGTDAPYFMSDSDFNKTFQWS